MIIMKSIHYNKFIIFVSILVLSIPGLSFTQVKTGKSWTDLGSSTPTRAEIKLLSSTIETSRLEIITTGFWQVPVRNVDGKTEMMIRTENSTPLLIKGAPDLGKLTASLAIPDLARMQINMIEEEYVDIPGISIIPSKGNLTRDIDPAGIPFEYGSAYQTDAFFPGVTAELRTPHIIRDMRGQVVVIYPFGYNPVQKILRVYTRLVIEVKAAGNDGENPLIGRREDGKAIRAFEDIYARNFMNYHEYRSASRYTPLEEDGNMLIISYESFMDEMQGFADWKNMSGIPAEIVNVSTIGTTAAQIKAYVANYYTTYGLTYLLLVGDAAQIPTSSTSAGPSDNDYGYIAGSDHYPDIFTGRFSAENADHVLTQVARTLNYELEPGLDPSFFQRALCIASSQGTGDDGEYDWQHQRNIRSEYLAYTYSYGAELYDGSQGEQDATGNPTQSMVANEINTGTGIISYTGHGSIYAWSTSTFNTSNIASLNNSNKLPFILSVACVNGNFVGFTCFAETWLRATYNNQPSGAVAALMSTINQSWSPPMEGQDEMVEILVETYPSNIKRSFGGICMNGCMSMNDEYGVYGDEMTDTWTIFGDPSLMVRTASPLEMIVCHADSLPLGSGQITVLSDQEGARVAVSNNFQLLGTAFINNGMAEVDFGPVNTRDTLTVTLTAFNAIPVIDSVVISGSCTGAPIFWLGITGEWNNAVNWSNGIVPGAGSQVIIPEYLPGEFYPSIFSDDDPVINHLDLQDGSTINIPAGVTITIGNGP